MDSLHVDCGTCVARGPACDDCVISVLLGAPQEGVDLDGDERAALSALAESGLVPPLRLVSAAPGPAGPDAGELDTGERDTGKLDARGLDAKRRVESRRVESVQSPLAWVDWA